MGYAEEYAVAQDLVFIKKVEMALVHAAIAINGEAAATPHALQRTKLAQHVLQDSGSWASKFAAGVAADPAITAISADVDIFNRVAAIWNDYALPHTTP